MTFIFANCDCGLIPDIYVLMYLLIDFSWTHNSNGRICRFLCMLKGFMPSFIGFNIGLSGI